MINPNGHPHAKPGQWVMIVCYTKLTENKRHLIIGTIHNVIKPHDDRKYVIWVNGISEPTYLWKHEYKIVDKPPMLQRDKHIKLKKIILPNRKSKHSKLPKRQRFR